MKRSSRAALVVALLLLGTAAAAARLLVVVAARDHVVTPGPATEFARLAKARLITLEGDCGHLAPGCESQKLNPAVAEFLRAP